MADDSSRTGAHALFLFAASASAPGKSFLLRIEVIGSNTRRAQWRTTVKSSHQERSLDTHRARERCGLGSDGLPPPEAACAMRLGMTR